MDQVWFNLWALVGGRTASARRLAEALICQADENTRFLLGVGPSIDKAPTHLRDRESVADEAIKSFNLKNESA